MPLDFDLSTFPKPNDLRGHCRRSSHNTCTYKGEFAIFLRQLGKTTTQSIIASSNNSSSSSNHSRQLLAFEEKLHQVVDVPYLPVQPLPNPVFLFEIRQLQQTADNKNNNTFRRDLGQFLNVDHHGFSEQIPHYRPGKQHASTTVVGGSNNHSNSLLRTIQREKDRYKINICDAQHWLVRQRLMRMARTSAAWIEAFLLPVANRDPTIHFTNRPQFEQLIQDWKRDPCGGGEEEETTAMVGQKLLKLLPEQYHLKK
jgi:hypothetical protein